MVLGKVKINYFVCLAEQVGVRHIYPDAPLPLPEDKKESIQD